MHIDMRVLELLSSKICHDLISPVSAINNGVELIEDIGDSVVDEAMKLIGDSAGLASRRLKLFRLAYGRAGSEESLGLQDVQPVVESYFAGGKIALNWNEGAVDEEIISIRGSLKLLINNLLLGEEVLAYGGSLSLFRCKEVDANGVKIEISGRGAQLSELLQDALYGKTSPCDLTPRSIQAYITGQFASDFGFVLSYEQILPEKLEFKLIKAAS